MARRQGRKAAVGAAEVEEAGGSRLARLLTAAAAEARAAGAAWRHGTAEDTGRRRCVDLWRRGKLAPGGAGVDLGEERRRRAEQRGGGGSSAYWAGPCRGRVGEVSEIENIFLKCLIHQYSFDMYR